LIEVVAHHEMIHDRQEVVEIISCKCLHRQSEHIILLNHLQVVVVVVDI
jgi:hypothetical protein